VHGYFSVFERCVLSGRGLCDEVITHPEKSYWLWCVDLETSWIRRPWLTGGLSRHKQNKPGKIKAKQESAYLRNINFFRCCKHRVLVHRRVRVEILLLFCLHAATNLVCDVRVLQPRLSLQPPGIRQYVD